ncbi:suppressor of hairless protein-like [Strongylocentrotus purpuratus]|uniref:Uncharacterized protein n=1 Tax=Strongylocentrotus purpuratus TaxID=7668 RepID=A0A7M7NFE5_STRPU|nr:suppressor of hairless protein-like [Strongylocentrotus purpuratus]XP_030835720.1 suppressor of hairless protein-like [Strongylocentrotus purpuratus]XP_030835721.1 suppressor of hairless protein-like [Strongylocentrotus purpuratus]
MHPQMPSDDDEPSLLDKFSYSLSLDDLIADMYSVHSWSYTTTTFHPGVRTPPQTTQQHQQHQQQQQQQQQHQQQQLTTTNHVTPVPHKPLVQDRHVVTTGDVSRKCNGLHAREKSPEIKKEEKSAGPVSPFCCRVSCSVRRSDVKFHLLRARAASHETII